MRRSIVNERIAVHSESYVGKGGDGGYCFILASTNQDTFPEPDRHSEYLELLSMAASGSLTQ